MLLISNALSLYYKISLSHTIGNIANTQTYTNKILFLKFNVIKTKSGRYAVIASVLENSTGTVYNKVNVVLLNER